MNQTIQKLTPSNSLGLLIRTLREGKKLTLRDVESATKNEVSNAYLSQIENGKINKPSPNVLHALAAVYEVAYETLMERAGYIAPSQNQGDGKKHGRAATFAIDNLTSAEEEELLKYLSFYRSQR